MRKMIKDRWFVIVRMADPEFYEQALQQEQGLEAEEPDNVDEQEERGEEDEYALQENQNEEVSAEECHHEASMTPSEDSHSTEPSDYDLYDL